MDRKHEIKQALDRAQSIFTAKPALARVTKGGRATLRKGLACEYVEDGRALVADMPSPLGGEDKGLSPGGYARAGLGMCLAIGYAMRAAQRGVDVVKIEVDLEADNDVASLFGLPGSTVGYGEFRFSVRIESAAPEEEILALIDEAD